MALEQDLTWKEAAEMLIESGVVEGFHSVGAGRDNISLSIPAGTIFKEGRWFKRRDVCRLIEAAKTQPT